MNTPRIVVLGDVMLDQDIEGETHRLCPDAPAPVVDVCGAHAGPGGAGLVALLCRHPLAMSGPGRKPARVRLVAPLADDEAGRTVRQYLRGVEVVALGYEGTTRRKTRVRVAGRSLLRLDDGGPGRPLHLDPVLLAESLADADILVVADYGAGMTHDPVVRDLLTAHAARRPVLWDPHPRGGDPVPEVLLATPNEAEARGVLGDPVGAPSALAADVRHVWAAQSVAVTVGPGGAYLAQAGATSHIRVAPVPVPTDTCGAGDVVTASAALALADGASLPEAVTNAMHAARDWVAHGGIASLRRRRLPGSSDRMTYGSTPGSIGVSDPPITWTTMPGTTDSTDTGLRHTDSAQALAERVRAGGGTVVATGGCFDILHTGHLQTLEAARREGDALIVLLNSDDSVRRRKGPDRPVVPAVERAEMLRALRCVDAVEIFHEDTPVRALERLRPDVWVKGADYRLAEMPERHVLHRWGAQVVLIPCVPGRSSTALLERASHG